MDNFPGAGFNFHHFIRNLCNNKSVYNTVTFQIYNIFKVLFFKIDCRCLNLKTDEISHFHKTGKHTTAFSEMFELSFGGYIIDTPGIKGFGMLDMEPWEISHYFTEIFEISKKCKYKNCSHTHEPGCAVKRAVEHGDIATTRYISYIGLLEEDEKYRKPY